MIYNYCYHRFIKERQNNMDLKMLKGLSLDDLLNVDFTKLTESEVAYVEKRLIRTVNRRIAKLKQTGLISQSKLSTKEKKGLTPYKAPKGGMKVTRGGKKIKINVRNKLIKSSNKARDILLKKTSKATAITEQEERYRKVISDTLGKDVKLDRRRLKRVGKLMKKAEELYGLGVTNKKFSGSPYVLQMIVDIVKSREYIKNEDAEEIINEAIENGYENAQRLMNELLKASEDEKAEIDFVTDDDMYGIY